MLGMLVMAAAAAAAPQTEMSLRCTIVEDAPLLARNAGTLTGALTGGPAPVPVMKPLPQVMVDGWSVDRMPIAEALGQLAADGGFTVEADSGLLPVSWKEGPTSLSSVVARLAQSAGGVPSFDGRVLRVAKPVPDASWRFQRPAGRDATLALLDALRGYGASEVSLDTDSITFRAAPAVVARIRKGLTASTNVIAFDVWTYRLKAASPVEWKALEEIAPLTERHPVADGGRFVVGYVSPEKVSGFLSRFGEVSALGSQTVAGPQGWAMEVPLAQCSPSADKPGSITLKPTWSGQTMSIDVSGATFGTGRVDAASPGSSTIIAGPSASGSRIVAVVRPRVLVAR